MDWIADSESHWDMGIDEHQVVWMRMPEGKRKRAGRLKGDTLIFTRRREDGCMIKPSPAFCISVLWLGLARRLGYTHFYLEKGWVRDKPFRGWLSLNRMYDLIRQGKIWMVQHKSFERQWQVPVEYWLPRKEE